LRFEVRGFGVDVIIVEPGLIVTNFGEVAAGSVSEASDGGAYGQFNTAVAKLTAEAYKGPMAKLGAGPDAVAKTISRALRARRPKPRYLVTASARLMVGQRRLTPDRVWDLMMRSQFPQPKG
jgi:short-subunit dehydrogenase